MMEGWKGAPPPHQSIWVTDPNHETTCLFNTASIILHSRQIINSTLPEVWSQLATQEPTNFQPFSFNVEFVIDIHSLLLAWDLPH